MLNAHRSIWGVGDYDANVLMIALGQEGLDVSWFDARLAIESIPLGGGAADDNADVDSVAALCAIITNVKSDSFFGALFGSRHWAALVRVGAQWFDLDSKRDSPKAFAAGAEGVRQMRAHLAACAATRGAEILLVRARAAEPPHAS